jgi:hypothetical protein
MQMALVASPIVENNAIVIINFYPIYWHSISGLIALKIVTKLTYF